MRHNPTEPCVNGGGWPVSSSLRTMLRPLELGYGGIMAMRNRLFDGGFLPTMAVQVPVISVGNLTVGGSGKTPIVRYLSCELLKCGRVGILLRGYGGIRHGAPRPVSLEDSTDDVGDEPLLLKHWLPDAEVVVSPDRVAGAKYLQTRVDAIVLDDGFQHRYLARDVDIVAIRPPLQLDLLPAGPMREPISALARADMAWLTGWDEEELASYSRTLVHAGLHNIVLSTIEVRSFDELMSRADVPSSWNGEDSPVARLLEPTLPRSFPAQSIRGIPFVTLTTIADGSRVCRMLESMGGLHRGCVHQADHSRIEASGVRQIVHLARSQNAQWILLTEKDAIKLPFIRDLNQVPERMVKHSFEESFKAMCRVVKVTLKTFPDNPLENIVFSKLSRQKR